VIEEGPGIPSDEISKIWSRLYRGDKSRSTKGLWLGLSLVSAIIKSHKATIDVNNNPAKGCTFTITFLSISFSFFILNQVSAGSDKNLQVTISLNGVSKHEYANPAKILLQKAIETVEKNYEGKIIETALEKEDGFLVNEIELISANKKIEVILDAGTGSVLLKTLHLEQNRLIMMVFFEPIRNFR